MTHTDELTDLERVRAAVRSLGEGRHRRERFACLVDGALRVHALRLWDREEESIPIAQRPVRASVDARDAIREATWIGLEPPPAAFAIHPTLWEAGGTVEAGIVGVQHPNEVDHAYHRVDFRAYACGPLEHAGRRAPEDVGLRVGRSAVRLSTAPEGVRYALTSAWRSPVVLTPTHPLVLSEVGERARVLAAPVAGTDAKGSYPERYALLAGARQLHVVYTGVRDGQDPKAPHLWHLALERDGALAEAHDLGLAPLRPLMIEILATSAGALHAFVLSSEDEGARLAADIRPLEARGEAGRDVHYLVDEWLGVHAVSFARGAAAHVGPTAPGA